MAQHGPFDQGSDSDRDPLQVVSNGRSFGGASERLDVVCAPPLSGAYGVWGMVMGYGLDKST